MMIGDDRTIPHTFDDKFVRYMPILNVLIEKDISMFSAFW